MNRPRPRLSDVLVQYRGVYKVLLPATQLTVAIRNQGVAMKPTPAELAFSCAAEHSKSTSV